MCYFEHRITKLQRKPKFKKKIGNTRVNPENKQKAKKKMGVFLLNEIIFIFESTYDYKFSLKSVNLHSFPSRGRVTMATI